MHYETWERWLAHLRGVPNVRMAEIGSWEGRSALWFADNILTGEGARIICIDTWEIAWIRGNFDYNVRKAPNGGRIKPYQGTSDWFDETQMAATFDAVYIDGDHSWGWVARDAENVWPALKVGGVLFFDDYSDPQFGVRQAVDEFVAKRAGEIDVYEGGSGQVMIRKAPPGAYCGRIGGMVPADDLCPECGGTH